MINDPAGASQRFDDPTIQDKLDEMRQDVWYEPLMMAPAIVNAASTNNVPSMVFANYYSRYQWWEDNVILQGNSTSTHAAWIVLTPAASDLIVGHWSFDTASLAELFASGTFPGQYPPVWATGKTYDLNLAAAELLDFWAATLTDAYDINVDGQSLKRSQLMQAKMKLADQYRRKALPRIAKAVRTDVAPQVDSKSTPVLGGYGLSRVL